MLDEVRKAAMWRRFLMKLNTSFSLTDALYAAGEELLAIERTPELTTKEPSCLGYEGGCDGDLIGEQHEPKCPCYVKPEPMFTLEQVREAARRAAFVNAGEEIIAILYPPKTPKDRVTLYWDEMEKLWFVCKDGISIGDQSWLDNEKFHAERYADGLRAELAKEADRG
jgi:hypothetical protein